jgi:hypothetical protein
MASKLDAEGLLIQNCFLIDIDLQYSMGIPGS